MLENKLAQEEARRAHQHSLLKNQVESTVDSHIAAQASEDLVEEQNRIAATAARMRQQAIDAVAETEQEVRAMRTLARFSQIVDAVFYVIYTLLGLRFTLALMAANNSAGFVRFIKALTEPVYAPFKNIVASPALETGSTLAFPLLIAIGVYVLVHLGIKGLLRVIAQRRTEL